MSQRKPKGTGNIISEKRFLDPKQNLLDTEKYTHVRKSKDAQKKITVGKKIRDMNRLLAHIESKGTADTELLQQKKLEIGALKKKKRDIRAVKFIDKKYKNIKFYGKESYSDLIEIKKLRKQLKRLDPESEDFDNQKSEIQQKLDYINFYPKSTKYISIINQDTDPEVAKRRQEILEQTKVAALKDREWRLKQISKDAGRKTKDVEKDGYFLNAGDESEGSDSDSDSGSVVRREVDKKGNVIQFQL